MRHLYVVAPDQEIDQSVNDAAQAAGCAEVAQGVPPRLVREGVSGTYPFVYTEPDDPEKAPLQQAVGVLRNTFKTPRTAAQINNSIDAITVILRRIAKNELEST